MKTLNRIVTACIVLTVILTNFSKSAHSQNGESGDKTLSPYFFVKSDDATLDQMPLKSTSAEVNIAGVIAAVKIRQVYKNEGKKTLEAVYVFPSSTRAAVHAMRMKIGERIIEAVIKEKGQARQAYEQAKNEGKSASLLEQHRPNVFQMNVANILPGDQIDVELDYTELLIPENRIYEFVYPTVVGPRYQNSQPMVLAAKDDKYTANTNPFALTPKGENWVANPYTTEGVKPSYTFNISCNLEAGMPVSDVRCPSHDIDITYKGKDKARLSLKNPSSYDGNKDFILQYRLSGNQLASGVLLYEGKDENFFLAMIQPPQRVKPTQVPPREYVFIVDVSGSMHGYPLNISKKLMKDLITSLRPVDKFNIVLFAGGSQVFSEASVHADKENIRKGIAFIDAQQGGGGTELLPALRTALKLGSSDEMSRSFIIATDGYVTVEKESFELIRNNLGNANFFAFGIGTSVNRYLIEGIAHSGMGEAFVVTKQEEAAKTAETFREYISSPVLTDIAVSYKGIIVYDVEPRSIPDVFSERPVIVFGKYKGKTNDASVQISGFGGEESFRENIALASNGTEASSLALRYLWARERIRNIDDLCQGGEYADAGKEVTALGLKYNLLTKYTSFVAIDSEKRNTEGGSTTVVQPLPLPEGVSNYAVGGITKTSGVNLSNTYSNCSAPPIVTESLSLDKEDDTNKKELRIKDTRKVKSDAVFTVAEEMAEYPGGSLALQEFIRKNMKYPQKAKENSVEGTVLLQLSIAPDGSITEVKVIKGIGSGCDEEAIRLIKMMPKWKPGKTAGKAVKVQLTLPVRFSL
ncbi:MAG: TonB family protein [Bacteroidales bacterium]